MPAAFTTSDEDASGCFTYVASSTSWIASFLIASAPFLQAWEVSSDNIVFIAPSYSSNQRQ